MRVKIDQDGCIECGACQDACSKVFVLKSGEKASIVEKFQGKDGSEGEVSNDLSECVESAAEECPVDVIDVT